MTDTLRKALEERLEYASNQYHDSTRWRSEEAPDGRNLWDWVLDAALSTPEKALSDYSNGGEE